MRNKRIIKIIQKIKTLDAESSKLIKAVLCNDPILIGSVYEVLRICGKSNCRCAEKPSHACVTLMTTHQGRRRCQVIRKKDVEKVQKKVERYKEIRNILRRLKALDLERNTLLKALIEERNELYK